MRWDASGGRHISRYIKVEIKGSDNKVRYVKPLSIEMCTKMFQKMRQVWGANPLIYLRIELWDMWDKIMDIQLRSISELDYTFADHFNWFSPWVNDQVPNKHLYLKNQNT